MSIVWIVASIALLIIELSTSFFVAIFFAIGAFFAALLAWAGIALEWQIASCGIISLASLLLLRKVILRKFNKDAQIQKDQHHLTKQHGTMTKAIESPHALGEVQIGGSFWQASSEKAIALGERVVVVGRYHNQDLVLEVTALQL